MKVQKGVLGLFVWYELKKIKIFVKKIQIPEEFLNEKLIEDANQRTNFKAWINDIWKEKDELISFESFN